MITQGSTTHHGTGSVPSQRLQVHQVHEELHVMAMTSIIMVTTSRDRPMKCQVFSGYVQYNSCSGSKSWALCPGTGS